MERLGNPAHVPSPSQPRSAPSRDAVPGADSPREDRYGTASK